MVTSNTKGTYGETVIRDKLRTLTGLQFERVPSSGALDPKHGLKGDLYLPNQNNRYCIEVKNYTDDHFTSKVLTDKNPQLFEWWAQALRQGTQVNKIPLLLFKFNRSKIFCGYQELPTEAPFVWISRGEVNINISLLEDFIKLEKPKFI